MAGMLLSNENRHSCNTLKAQFRANSLTPTDAALRLSISPPPYCQRPRRSREAGTSHPCAETRVVPGTPVVPAQAGTSHPCAETPVVPANPRRSREPPSFPRRREPRIHVRRPRRSRESPRRSREGGNLASMCEPPSFPRTPALPAKAPVVPAQAGTSHPCA